MGTATVKTMQLTPAVGVTVVTATMAMVDPGAVYGGVTAHQLTNMQRQFGTIIAIPQARKVASGKVMDVACLVVEDAGLVDAAAVAEVAVLAIPDKLDADRPVAGDCLEVALVHQAARLDAEDVVLVAVSGKAT
ncbi:MAG TPA: hypothetical protein PKD64_06690 [Pirellulaceae bacterium]|nr:hypothetical protein [Pirellulaceae bacterium]HMO91870.1 hypothetical protein [Pirellulaceae bacterium]